MKDFSTRPIYGWLFLLLLFILYYLIQRNVPYLIDDYLLQLAKATDANGNVFFADALISSVGDLWKAIVGHRAVYNGRLSDSFAMSFLYFFKDSGFAVINTVALILMVLICSQLCFKKITLVSVAVTTVALFLLLPNIPYSFFWLCGACNYLWGGLFLCLFLLAFNKIKSREPHRYVQYAVVLLALITAAMHEALGLTLLGMLLTDAVIRTFTKRTPFSTTEWFIVGAVILGVSFPLSASVLYDRAASGDGGDIKKLQWIAYTVAFSVPVMTIFLMTLLKLKKNAIFNHLTYFIIANLGLLLLVLLFAGGSGAWGGNRFYLSLGVILLFLQTFSSFIEKHGRLFCCISIAGFLAWWYPTFSFYSKAADIHEQVENTAITSSTVVIDTSDNPEISEHDALFHSLPYHLTECSHMWRCLKGEPFFVIFKAFKTNAEVYEKCQATSRIKCTVVHDKDISYIRLPKNICFYHRRLIEAQNCTTGQIGALIPYAPLGASTKLTSTLYFKFVKKYGFTYRMCCDYDGEFYYILIKELPAGSYSLKVNVYDVNEPQRIYTLDIGFSKD